MKNHFIAFHAIVPANGAATAYHNCTLPLPLSLSLFLRPVRRLMHTYIGSVGSNRNYAEQCVTSAAKVCPEYSPSIARRVHHA